MNTQLKVGYRVRVISGYFFSSTSFKDAIPTNLVVEIKVVDATDDTVLVSFNGSEDLWVHNDKTFIYEQIPPTPKWLPIDKDNLPQTLLAAINRKEDTPQVYTGALFYSDGIGSQNGIYIRSIGGYIRYYDFTHYIPLTDLLNLPIAE